MKCKLAKRLSILSIINLILHHQLMIRKMQKQVDTYKQTLAKQLEARYPQNRLFTDHAIQVNNFAKKVVPSGGELDELKEALNLTVKLADISG